MTDAELLESYKSTRDRSVLDSLFARHYPTVYHVVLKMVRNSTDAGDLTQSAFLKALEAADDWKPTGSLRNWLLAIAVNEVRQFRRSAARRNRPEHLQAIARREEPADLQRREFEEHLEQALQQFPDELKEPLVLHYYENLSYSEMAEVLAIPKSTVQFRMDQALRKLREQLQKRGVFAVFAAFLPRRPVFLGLTAMKLKILATSLILLCCLFPFGALVWKSQRAARPEAPEASTSASPKKPAAVASKAVVPVPDGAAIFGRVLEKGTDAPIAGALVAVYNVEENSTDQTLTDESGAFRLASTLGSRAMHQLKITAKGYAPLSAPSLAASPAPGTYRLSPGGTITGLVEDLRGLPVFPYRIAVVRDRTEGAVDEVQTLYHLALPEKWVVEEPEASYWADGRFELRHVEPGEMALVVLVEGAQSFSTEQIGRWEVKVHEGKTTKVRIVRPDSGTLRIRVVDSTSRAPIPGAQVAIITKVGRHRFDFGATPVPTDADGLCALPVSLNQHRDAIAGVYVGVSKAGYSSEFVSLGGQENGLLRVVVLGKRARLHGRVQSPDGTPIEGAAIYIFQPYFEDVLSRVFTDPRGEYEAADLNAPGRYLVYVFDRSLRNVRAVSTVLLREGEDRELHFGVPGEASISGTVTWKGSPVRAASICLDPEAGLGSRILTYTNDRGEYRLAPLQAGTYELSVRLPGDYPDGELTREVTVREKESTRVDFPAGELRIRGTVLMSGTTPPDDQERVRVVARRVGGVESEAAKMVLLDNGPFELDLPQPGIYELTISDDYGYVGGDPVRIDLTARSEVEDVRLYYRRNARDGELRLLLVDAATGEPLPVASYEYNAPHARGSGYFDDGLLKREGVGRGRFKYVLGGPDHVSASLDVDLTSRTREERTIALHRSEAVRVGSVYSSGPADKAGLREGDVIVSYDGQPTPNSNTLVKASWQGVGTKKVPVEIRRGGETLILFVAGGDLEIDPKNSLLPR